MPASPEHLQAVLAKLEEIPRNNFDAYPGGWRGEISTALVDAVFSIQMRYHTKDPCKGVFGRVRRFRELHPDTLDDLGSLVNLGSEAIMDIMTRSKTSGNPKGVASIQAAKALLECEVRTSEDFTRADLAPLKKAYTSVRGLGPVTFEYVAMNLGVPGVKADTMIVRFVNKALSAAGLEKTDATGARHLIELAHGRSDIECGLTEFDHAIWLWESNLARSRKPLMKAGHG